MKRLLALALVLCSLAACQPEPADPATDEAAAAELLLGYEAARAEADYEIAEARGDQLRQRHGETRAAAQVRETLPDVRAKAEAMRDARRLKGLWDYQRVSVPGGVQHTAAIYSYVEVDPEAEPDEAPAATPDARLILRRHPEWGDSAYLVLSQRALSCPPPCTLMISFDQGPAQRFAGEPADTGTGPALFIKDRDGFLEAMRDAQRVRIELPRSGHLVPVFDFEVGGFVSNRHLAD
jgi:hypothetical protein